MSSKEEQISSEIDGVIEDLSSRPIPDKGRLPAVKQLPGFISLVQVLESALLIVQARYHKDPPEPEPFPGAVAAVVRQSLAAVEMMRMAGCQPLRDKRE